jgi:NAD(P)H dehydrogenase (quinone)
MDFDDPASLDLTGIMTLLLVSAGYAEDDVVIQRHENIIAAAERQGVGHVVYTSLTGSGDHLAFALAHRWTERRLQRSSMAWTILRNGLYAELIGARAAPINGTIYAPFGSGRISSVAREDLADAAIAVLSAPANHVSTIYELSGDTPWNIADLANTLGVAYAPTPLAQERTKLNAAPLQPFQPAMLLSIYSAAAAGFLDAPQSDLAKLLASSPRDSLALAVAEARPKSPTP